MYRPRDDSNEVLAIPDMDWIPLGIFNGSAYSTLYTHPLERAEMEKVSGEVCPDSEDGIDVDIFLHGGPTNPVKRLSFNMTTFPRTAVSMPASNGVTVRVDCAGAGRQAFEYACLPVKFDVGKLTCSALRRTTSRRKRRHIHDKSTCSVRKQIAHTNEPFSQAFF